MRATGFLVTTAMAAVLADASARADVIVSGKATQNMTCSAGVCSPTAPKAVLNVTELANMLAGGDVKIVTGSGATNIVVKDGFSWTSTSRLTLDAIQSVEFDKKVTVAGTGAVTITTNDGGSGGDLLFGDKGNLTFWDLSSSLTVNGNSYTLAKDIATLASDIAANPSGFYALANDYDASVDGTYSSAPITTALKGTFEGLGHDISNLKIVSADTEVGLFADAFGTLRDIDLAKVSIRSTGSQDVVGGLLARGDGATVIGCSASGFIVFGYGYGGGLVGGADADITRSYTSVTVSGGDNASVGGIIGANGSAISLSYATGHVKGGSSAFVGGVVGSLFIGGNIQSSYARGKALAGENGSVGGLVGLEHGPALNAYAMGAVSGVTTGTIGGFAGEIGLSKLQFSYSTGHVKGGNISGGFIGNGTGSDDLAFDYWDTQTSGKSRHEGYGECHDSNCGRAIKGLKTSKFQSGLPEGFDPKIWGQSAKINDGFPYLLALPPK